MTLHIIFMHAAVIDTGRLNACEKHSFETRNKAPRQGLSANIMCCCSSIHSRTCMKRLLVCISGIVACLDEQYGQQDSREFGMSERPP